MKIFIKILSIVLIFTAGCSMSSVTVRENQIGNGLKPLLEKQHEDKQINVGVPIYTF